jgi:protein-tyrosine-phosphatase
MEINGRFWGSLPLAIASGVDFPYGLYELLVADRRPAPVEYSPGLYARNLLRDLDWFIERWGAERSDPCLLTVPLRRLRREIGIALRGRERWDTFTLDDPRPGLLELRQAAASLVRRAGRAVRRVCSTLTRASYPWRAWQRRRMRRLLTNRPAILLVCKGNICRSPFAELYLRRALIARGLRQIAVASAGFFPEVGRPSPIEACVAAREFGVELDAHRSIRISADLVARSGAILCMDTEDANALRSAFPAAASKSLLLGALGPHVPKAMIPDPWGYPVEVFSACYRLIVSSLDVVISSVSDPV